MRNRWLFVAALAVLAGAMVGPSAVAGDRPPVNRFAVEKAASQWASWSTRCEDHDGGGSCSASGRVFQMSFNVPKDADRAVLVADATIQYRVSPGDAAHITLELLHPEDLTIPAIDMKPAGYLIASPASFPMTTSFHFTLPLNDLGGEHLYAYLSVQPQDRNGDGHYSVHGGPWSGDLHLLVPAA